MKKVQKCLISQHCSQSNRTQHNTTGNYDNDAEVEMKRAKNKKKNMAYIQVDWRLDCRCCGIVAESVSLSLLKYCMCKTKSVCPSVFHGINYGMKIRIFLISQTNHVFVQLKLRTKIIYHSSHPPTIP